MLLSDFHEGISSVLDWLHVCKDTAVSKLSAMFLYLILFGGHILSILSAISMKWGGGIILGDILWKKGVLT